MTLHEKSAWVSVGAIVLLYIPYFMQVNAYPMASLYLFWVVGIGMAVIMVLFHTIDAVVHVVQKREGALQLVDELDRAIEHNAMAISGILLAVVVVIWVMVMMYALPVFGSSVVETTSDSMNAYVAWPIDQVMRAIQWLFAGFVMANLVFYGVVIAQYRSMRGE